MANLLPTKEQKHIYSERRNRFIIVVLIGLLGSMLIATLLLLPSFVLTSSSLAQAHVQLESIQKLSDLTRDTDANAQVTQLEADVHNLQETMSNESALSTLDDILGRITDNVQVQVITYRHVGENVVLTLGGRAGTRDALLAFKDALENSTQIASVDLPVASLADRYDIAFTLTLTLSGNSLSDSISR